MATLQEMRNEVLAHQFSAQRYSTLVDGWLNEGQNKVSRKAKIRTRLETYDFSTVASTQTYDLPSDYSSFQSLTNRSVADPIAPIDLRAFDDLEDASGNPEYYVIIGNSIYLYPTPSSAVDLRLRYRALPDAMTTNDSESPLPSDYHNLLISYALYKAFQAEHDLEFAQYHKAEFDQGLMDLRTALTEDDREDPKQIQGMYGYDD